MTRKLTEEKLIVGSDTYKTDETVDQDDEDKRQDEDANGRDKGDGDGIQERVKRDHSTFLERDRFTTRVPSVKKRCTSDQRDPPVELLSEIVLRVPNAEETHASVVSWIYEQPYDVTTSVKFSEGDKDPYSTACDWIRRAIQMGNQSLQQRAVTSMRLRPRNGVLIDTKSQDNADDALKNAWEIYNATQDSSEINTTFVKERKTLSVS